MSKRYIDMIKSKQVLNRNQTCMPQISREEGERNCFEISFQFDVQSHYLPTVLPKQKASALSYLLISKDDHNLVFLFLYAELHFNKSTSPSPARVHQNLGVHDVKQLRISLFYLFIFKEFAQKSY